MSIDRKNCDTDHGKYVTDSLNARGKSHPREKRVSNNLTKTCCGLGLLHSDSNMSVVSYEDQREYILTQVSHISGQVGN